MPKKQKKLTIRQQAALKNHAAHHTTKHMAEMRKAILNDNFKSWANEFLLGYDGGII